MADVSTDISSDGRNVWTQLNCIATEAESPPIVTYSCATNTQRYNDAYSHIRVQIEDGRSANHDFSLDQHGFTLLPFHPKMERFDDDDTIRAHYYPQVGEAVKKATGAARVFTVNHVVRGTPGSVRRPALHVHTDFTENAPDRAAEMLGDEYAALANLRMVQVNLWRPLNGPVRRSPLALMDAQTLNMEDLVLTEIQYEDADESMLQHAAPELYSVRFSPQQRWVYFPEISGEEAILIKGYDTLDDGRARFVPHTAFEDPATPDSVPPRESIETRSFAFI